MRDIPPVYAVIDADDIDKPQVRMISQMSTFPTSTISRGLDRNIASLVGRCSGKQDV